MSGEVLERLFDPFFTTKRNQGGTGLGLYIVYNLISQKLGGSVVACSAPGCGVAYRVPAAGLRFSPSAGSAGGAHTGFAAWR